VLLIARQIAALAPCPCRWAAARRPLTIARARKASQQSPCNAPCPCTRRARQLTSAARWVEGVPRPCRVQRPVQRPASVLGAEGDEGDERPVATMVRCSVELIAGCSSWLCTFRHKAQGTQHTARSAQYTASPARFPARDPARRANTVGGCTRARSVPHCSRVSSCLGRGSSRRDAPAARSTHGLSGWAGAILSRRRRDLWAGCKWALGTGHADAQPPTPLALEGPRGARHSRPVIILPDRSRRRGSQQPITLPNTQ
jgi:hypothetical protein